VKLISYKNARLIRLVTFVVSSY